MAAPPAASSPSQFDLRETALQYQTLLARARLRELEHRVDDTIALTLAAAALEESLGEAHHEAHDRLLRAHDQVGWSDTAVVPTEPVSVLVRWLPGEEAAVFATPEDGCLVVIDTRTGARRCVLEGSAHASEESLSADGGYLVAHVSEPTAIAVWSLRTGERVGTIPCAAEASAALSPDGARVLLVDGADASVWDVASASRLRVLPTLADVRESHFAGNGQWVLRVSNHGEAVLAALTGGDRQLRFVVTDEDTGEVAPRVAVSADGQWLLAHSPGRIRLWSLATGALRLSLGLHAPASPADFTPDGRGVYFSEHGRLVTWDLATQRRRREWTPYFPFARESEVLPGGRVVSSPENPAHDHPQRTVIQQWGTHALDLIEPRSLRPELSPRDFSPEGRHAVVGHRLFSAQTGRRVATFLVPIADPHHLGAALSPHANYVAIHYATHLEVWTASLDRRVLALPSTESRDTRSPFSPDETEVVTLDHGRPTRWSLPSGGRRVVYPPTDRALDGLRFADDGRAVIAQWRGTNETVAWDAPDAPPHPIEPPEDDDAGAPQRRQSTTFHHGPWTIVDDAWSLPGSSVFCGGAGNHSALFRRAGDRRTRARLDFVDASTLRPWHFSHDHLHVLSDTEGYLAVWDLRGTVASMRRDLLDRTNLRVCRDSLAVVPVVLPRPDALQDSAYATDDECRAAEANGSRP